MNINKIGKDGYYATVTTADGHSWGFTVAEHHGTLFTMELAQKILNWANQEVKKGCPCGYAEEFYSPDAVFVKLGYDMTGYRQNVNPNGDVGYVPTGKKKIGTYDDDKHLLRIWEDDLPVYENDNGRVCRDWAALSDSLM